MSNPTDVKLCMPHKNCLSMRLPLKNVCPNKTMQACAYMGLQRHFYLSRLNSCQYQVHSLSASTLLFTVSQGSGPAGNCFVRGTGGPHTGRCSVGAWTNRSTHTWTCQSCGSGQRTAKTPAVLPACWCFRGSTDKGEAACPACWSRLVPPEQISFCVCVCGGGTHCLVAGLVIIVSPEQILLSWLGVGGSHGLTSWLLTW